MSMISAVLSWNKLWLNVTLIVKRKKTIIKLELATRMEF